MRVILFGASGMIGQGVLRECLLDPETTEVLAVSRSPLGASHPKLRELLHHDFTDFSGAAEALRGYDACLYCLGVSAAGMTEQEYTRVTLTYTVAAAEVLVRVNPAMTFVFISGAGTDSSEKGRVMWARVKGRAENVLLKMPFAGVYMFRPGLIQPRHGIRSRTRLYRVMYVVFGFLFPLFRLVAPRQVLTTESLGLAMIAAAKRGAPRTVLEAPDINALLTAT